MQSFLFTLIGLWTNWLKNMQQYKESLLWSGSVCIYIYIYIHSNTFGKRHGCMYAVCPSIWVKQQNETNRILRSGIFPFKANVMQKMMVRLNFIKVVLYLFTYINIYIFYFCKNIAFHFRNYLVFKAILSKKMKPLRYKQMPWWKKRMRLNLIKGCIAFFHTL